MDQTTQSDNSTADILPTHLEAVPLALAHLLPETSHGQFILQMLVFGVLSTFGVITNFIAILVIIRGRLFTNWTHGMILNLAVTDLLLCLNFCLLFLPTAVNGW